MTDKDFAEFSPPGEKPVLDNIFQVSDKFLGSLVLYLSASTLRLPLSQVAGITYRSTSTTWNPANIADGAMTSTTVTLSGATLGDIALVSFSVAVPAGAILAASVTAANTVTVTLFNKTGGALDLASGTVKVAILR